MTPVPMPGFHQFASREALAQELAATVADRLRMGLSQRGGATLAVSGGTTPGAFFDALSKEKLDWTKVVVTLVDERFVPPASDRSNEKLVRERLLVNEARLARFIPLVPREIDDSDAERPPPRTPPLKGEGGVSHRTTSATDVGNGCGASESPSPLWGSEGRARQAARPGKVRGGGAAAPIEQSDPIESAAGSADAGIALLGQPLDAVVLGMGADGHTASFFPDAPNLDELLDPAQTRRVMPVIAPSGGEPRLTLTLPLIAGARFLALHIEGREKRAVLDQALSDASPTLPIRRVLDAAASQPQIYWTA